jgi:hypothetical protein
MNPLRHRPGRGFAAALAPVGLAAAAGSARADVAPPPTFLIDSLWLGWPVGPFVGVALCAAAVGGFYWLRRRGARGWLAGILCLGCYAAANFGVYVYGLRSAAQQREKYRLENQFKRPAPAPTPAVRPAPAATP